MSLLAPFLGHSEYWSKIADLNLLHLSLVPSLEVMSLEFRRDFWQQKTRVPGLWCGVVCVILGLAVFVELRRVTVGQTDKRTDRHKMTAYTALS